MNNTVQTTEKLENITSTNTTDNYSDSELSKLQLEKPGLACDLSEPANWPRVTAQVRCYLIENGPHQNTDYNFSLSEDNESRRFSSDWFVKKLCNDEKVQRRWLLYSPKMNALFCFPCLLFCSKSNTSSFANRAKGFGDWRHLSPRIPEHENSLEHRKC